MVAKYLSKELNCYEIVLVWTEFKMAGKYDTWKNGASASNAYKTKLIVSERKAYLTQSEH